MNKVLLIIVGIFIIIFGIYFYINRQAFGHGKIAKTGNPCSDFSTLFGATPSELIDYVNSYTESATILSGWQHLYGEILGKRLIPSYPVLISLNNGKITSITCQKPNFALDAVKDVRFTMPKADFRYIVTNRQNLEANEAMNYLQNLNTKPSSVKLEILQRIENQE